MNYTTAAYSLTFALSEGQCISGTIHSVYNHAVNLQFVVDNKTKLITCLEESMPFVVDSFLVEKTLFEKIRKLQNSEVVLKKNEVVFADFTITLENPLSSKLLRKNLNDQAIEKLLEWQGEISGLQMINEKRRKMIMESLEQFAKTGNFDDVVSVVGYGGGLTPGCDDAIVGIMMILDLDNRVHVENFSACEVAVHMATTDVSEKYLMAALNHHYSYLLLHLLDTLSENEGVEEAIEQLIRVGATSGKDMLQGVVMTLKMRRIR